MKCEEDCMNEVILFGTGMYYEKKYQSIKEKYKVKCCLDNRIGVGEKQINKDGLTVINPKDLDDSSTIIFLMSVRFIDMWKQMVSLGVNPDRLEVPFSITSYFENDEAIIASVDKILFSKDYFICVLKDGNELVVRDEDDWKEALRDFYRKKYPIIDAISNMDTMPVSQQFATERGTPIDRKYIDYFLRGNKQYITGDVLEIEDGYYTKKFGDNYKSIVMDVSSDAACVDFNANLEIGEGIKEGIADCFILTQTLMYIYDLEKTSDSIYKLLKPGGVLLITCSGISQNSRRCMDNYGCYFSFNASVYGKMFGDKNKFEIVESGSLGNAKTSLAHLAGLCCEDLKESDFEFNDKYYPLISYAVVRRK